MNAHVPLLQVQFLLCAPLEKVWFLAGSYGFLLSLFRSSKSGLLAIALSTLGPVRIAKFNTFVTTYPNRTVDLRRQWLVFFSWIRKSYAKTIFVSLQKQTAGMYERLEASRAFVLWQARVTRR